MLLWSNLSPASPSIVSQNHYSSKWGVGGELPMNSMYIVGYTKLLVLSMIQEIMFLVIWVYMNSTKLNRDRFVVCSMKNVWMGRQTSMGRYYMGKHLSM